MAGHGNLNDTKTEGTLWVDVFPNKNNTRSAPSFMANRDPCNHLIHLGKVSQPLFFPILAASVEGCFFGRLIFAGGGGGRGWV